MPRVVDVLDFAHLAREGDSLPQSAPDVPPHRVLLEHHDASDGAPLGRGPLVPELTRRQAALQEGGGALHGLEDHGLRGGAGHADGDGGVHEGVADDGEEGRRGPRHGRRRVHQPRVDLRRLADGREDGLGQGHVLLRRQGRLVGDLDGREARRGEGGDVGQRPEERRPAALVLGRRRAAVQRALQRLAGVAGDDADDQLGAQRLLQSPLGQRLGHVGGVDGEDDHVRRLDGPDVVAPADLELVLVLLELALQGLLRVLAPHAGDELGKRIVRRRGGPCEEVLDNGGAKVAFFCLSVEEHGMVSRVRKLTTTEDAQRLFTHDDELYPMRSTFVYEYGFK